MSSWSGSSGSLSRSDSATVYLPTEIFDIDIRPGVGEPPQVDPGIGAPRSVMG